MNEKLTIKHDRYGKKIAWITCPYCGNGRWMRLQNFERGGKTGLCLKCHNSRGHTETERELLHDGYVLVSQPNHPRAVYGGFVKRAVLVMETHLGRYLASNEHIHHINSIRKDDRLENLTILSNSEHAQLHRKLRLNLNNQITNGTTSAMSWDRASA